MATSGVSSTSTYQSLPEEILFIDDVTLKQELAELGDQPGPITDITRHFYQKRLLRLKNITGFYLRTTREFFRKANLVSLMPNQSVPRNQTSELSNLIRPDLEFGDWLNRLDTYRSLEMQVSQEFALPDRTWRGGIFKTSFTYLLLDPRITQDLPNRSVRLTRSKVWSDFLKAIFYI
ncbi:PREDICTED: ankyrin repeat and LEM domain-containing protein 1-like, partial [Wasmannia auropunctata]|uniref:ankyrin repeat and LEM domain-containing protein 1-like n=1 Tax=Wasmannia auropunctata TaxID=64793 RepID=UPI0005EE4027